MRTKINPNEISWYFMILECWYCCIKWNIPKTSTNQIITVLKIFLHVFVVVSFSFLEKLFWPFWSHWLTNFMIQLIWVCDFFRTYFQCAIFQNRRILIISSTVQTSILIRSWQCSHLLESCDSNVMQFSWKMVRKKISVKQSKIKCKSISLNLKEHYIKL